MGTLPRPDLPKSLAVRVGIERLRDDLPVHPAITRSVSVLEPKVLEPTRQDLRCLSREVDGEPRLREPRPELGDRPLSDQGVPATSGRPCQQRRPDRRLDDVGVGRLELAEGVALLKLVKTEFHFPSHRVTARHLFRRHTPVTVLAR